MFWQLKARRNTNGLRCACCACCAGISAYVAYQVVGQYGTGEVSAWGGRAGMGAQQAAAAVAWRWQAAAGGRSKQQQQRQRQAAAVKKQRQSAAAAAAAMPVSIRQQLAEADGRMKMPPAFPPFSAAHLHGLYSQAMIAFFMEGYTSIISPSPLLPFASLPSSAAHLLPGHDCHLCGGLDLHTAQRDGS